MPLTTTAIRNARPHEKPLKLFDGGGLFLLVSPSGGKWWRLKYRFDGKEKLLSLGTFPEGGLKDARERRDEARKQLAADVDPGEHRKAVKSARSSRGANSFEVRESSTFLDWLSKSADSCSSIQIPEYQE